MEICQGIWEQIRRLVEQHTEKGTNPDNITAGLRGSLLVSLPCRLVEDAELHGAAGPGASTIDPLSGTEVLAPAGLGTPNAETLPADQIINHAVRLQPTPASATSQTARRTVVPLRSLRSTGTLLGTQTVLSTVLYVSDRQCNWIPKT